MEHGIVTDWDDMERIWSWVYAEELGTLSEEVGQLVFPNARPTDLFPASSIIDRGTAEPTQQQGYRCTNILRHIQCPSTVHFGPGCAITVRTRLHLSHGPLFTSIPGIRPVVQRGSSWILETASHTPYRFSKGFQCPMLSEGLMLLEGNRGSESRFCGALRTASVGTSLITYNSYFGKLATTYTPQPSLRSSEPSRKSRVTSPSIRKKRRKIPQVGQKISSCRTETQYRCVLEFGAPPSSNDAHLAQHSWVQSGSGPQKSFSIRNL